MRHCGTPRLGECNEACESNRDFAKKKKKCPQGGNLAFPKKTRGIKRSHNTDEEKSRMQGVCPTPEKMGGVGW